MTSKLAYFRGPSAAIALLAALAFTGPVAAEDFATVTFAANTISFAPTVDHRGGVVTVGGEGINIRREFQAGEAPSIATVDLDGKPFPDGTYKYEIRFFPSKKDMSKAEAKDGRTSKDGGSTTEGTAPAGKVQSGSFGILNGSIIDPNLTEATDPDAAASEGK